MFLADQRDIDRFVMLCRQYAMRFGHSVYADHFLAGVASAALKAELIPDLASFQKFHSFVSTLTPEERGRFLLTVAREETVDGQVRRRRRRFGRGACKKLPATASTRRAAGSMKRARAS